MWFFLLTRDFLTGFFVVGGDVASFSFLVPSVCAPKRGVRRGRLVDIFVFGVSDGAESDENDGRRAASSLSSPIEFRPASARPSKH